MTLSTSTHTRHYIQRPGIPSWTSALSSLAGHLLAFKPRHTSEEVGNTILSFLHHFDTSNLPSIWDPSLQALCLVEAERRGYSVEVLKPYLVLGLNITTAAYHYIDDTNVKMFISFFCMFLIYLDDVYPDDSEALGGVPDFTRRFTSSEKQPSKILNDLADLLTESSQYFGKVTADFIVHSALKFITGLILEVQSKFEPTHRIEEYAIFLREQCGLAEAFAMFIFPRDIPYHLYIQALPSMRDFIDFANDILSFYKEECSGDTNNFISLLAQARGSPKIKVLRYVVRQCLTAYERTLRILSPHREAHKAFRDFTNGYLALHLGMKRYRLSELGI
ncbi:isoprenoid synthase domain-containing protein [Armillaria luteobubalina]|uniref:Isoprenoid synthase domain-containing protein n=1 Tax=Armillaria luteobubalina TaxID=153913 RepID=A0AA39QPG9_9AGAR|nr:isoprenoid synthase domain-containing protein [Armillaria luteobubalina]